MKITLLLKQKVYLQPADYAGVLYLLLPVVSFFGFYTIAAIAIPSVAFLIYCVSRLKITRAVTTPNHWLLAVNAIATFAVVISSGAAGPLYVNSDWYKHYAVFNELARHSTLSEQAFTLRYYIGAYIFPSFAEKAYGYSAGVMLASWIGIGLFIFLNQLSSLLSSTAIKYIAPFIFILFSGADIVGNYITNLQWGPIHHFEWWVGWVQYSSPVTSIFWAPQSTLPAWICIAIVLRKESIDEKFFVYPIVLMCCLLWSPFAAVGIAPFLLATLVKRDLLKLEVSALYIAGILFLSALIAYYLTFDSGQIPKHWVWDNPCLFTTDVQTCFTIKGYATFILLEVGLLWAIAVFSKSSNKLVLNTALLTLLILPLFQIGISNELAMNASRPAIAALIIGIIISLQDRNPIRIFLAAILFAAGVATPAGEILRSFELDRAIASDSDVSTFVSSFPQYSSQYVTKKKIWFLREE